MTVYLLHAERPYIPVGCERKPWCWMRHYLGSAVLLESRIAAHQGGGGSNVCLVWKQAGIPFVLARTWEGGRAEERRIKRAYHFPRICPECHPMPRINRWAGGQIASPADSYDPWAVMPEAI